MLWPFLVPKSVGYHVGYHLASSRTIHKKVFLLNLKKKIKKRQQKQAHQHDTFKLKLHWQLQANDQACTPSFEHIRQTPKSEKSTIKSKLKGILN